MIIPEKQGYVQGVGRHGAGHYHRDVMEKGAKAWRRSNVLLLVLLTVSDGDRAQQLPVRLAAAEASHTARRAMCSRSAVAEPRVPALWWRLRGGEGTGAKAERARKLRIRQERKAPPKMDKRERERQRDKILVVERVGGQYRRSYEERSAADRPQGAQAPKAADSTGRHTFSKELCIEILYSTHSLFLQPWQLK
jgi:hypothetical protein